MPLNFYPRAGQVLVADFSDLKEPEICKVRPVVVTSPRLPHRSELVTIVPISLTGPKHDLPFVVRLSKNYHPDEDDALPCWAKCDLIMNISISRLNGFKIGRRKWATPLMDGNDLAAVRIGMLHGLGMGHLLKPGE